MDRISCTYHHQSYILTIVLHHAILPKAISQSVKIGFVLCPYDLYVADKMVTEQQLPVCWHVDNFKVSYMIPKVIDSILEEGLYLKEGISKTYNFIG